MKKTAVTAFCAAVFGAFLASAVAQVLAVPANQFGVVSAAPGTPWVAGQCVVIGSPQSGSQNTFVLAPAPCPTLSIGSAITGAVPGAAFTADANAKLAQFSALSAN